MNLTDLRGLLEERAAEPQNVAHHARLAGVRARVAIRRRRIVAGAACALAAVLCIAYVLVPLRPSAINSGTKQLIEGFPEYTDGHHIIAAVSGRLPTRTASLTVTSAKALTVFTRCTQPLYVEISINGGRGGRSTCTSAGMMLTLKDGNRIGQPTTVTMTVISSNPTGRSTPPPVPEVGVFAFALGEEVPFAEYPFPPRPDKLEQLSDHPPSINGKRADDFVRSDPADHNRPRELTVAWHGADYIYTQAQTPGILHVLVNGVEVGKHTSWDYRCVGSAHGGDDEWETKFGLHLKAGDQVKIKIVPEHMNGDWWVGIYRRT